MIAPLRIAAYRRLALSYLLNEVAWNFGTIALAVLVFDRTHSAMGVTALFLATSFAPAVLAPALTARLDGLAARRIVPALYTVEVGIFAALVVASQRFSLPVVLTLALADSAVAIAGRALTRATVAAVLKPVGLLDAGNRLINVLQSLGAAVGPALAGGVVAVAGIGASLGMTAIVFAVMAVNLSTARTLPPARGEGDRSWRERLREGLAYVRGHAAVRRVLSAHALALSLAAGAAPVEVVYARQSLHGGPGAYGILLGAWGVGTVLSSVAITRARGASAVGLVVAGAGAIGAGYLLMAVAPALPLAVAGCLLGGAGNGVYCIGVIQAVQERIADEFQARVMGLVESLTASCYGAGFLVGGALTALADPRAALAFSGVGVLVAVAATARLVRPERSAAAQTEARALRPVPDATG